MSNKPDEEKLKAEVDVNYITFTKMSFKERDTGKFALLRNSELVEILASHSECCILGDKKYADGVYSVQEIMGDFEDDLGFIDYALR